MPTISVRISDEEKRKLLQYAPLSEAVREGIQLYLKKKKSQHIFRKLEHLQRVGRIKTSSLDEVKLIKEDRHR